MTNSFWREVLDHIPHLFLVFRVDEKEEAHLIFVNSRVQELLGYKPEEFVLASESTGSHVQSNIHSLVEKIARLSKYKKNPSDTINKEGDQPFFKLISRRGALHPFAFNFRIFEAKSVSKPFIAVSMIPALEKADWEKADWDKSGLDKSGLDKSGYGLPDKLYRHQGQSFFVAESPLMKSLIQKMDALAGQTMPLLFRGERGTGKKTLARQFLRTESLSGCKWEEWNLPAMTKAEQSLAVITLCGKSRHIEDEDAEAPDADADAEAPDAAFCLLILEINQLTTENQVMLLGWLRQRSQYGRQTRILATSTGLLEESVQKGNFSTELYYHLSFETLLLPPLSQRKEDLRQLAEKWISEASVIFGMDGIYITDKEFDRITAYSWVGNFPEFYDVMRYSLLYSKNGRFKFRVPSEVSSSVRPPGMVDPSETADRVSFDDFVSFDEMSRRYLQKVLEKTGGKIYGVAGAAHLLDMKPTTLQSKLKKLGVR